MSAREVGEGVWVVTGGVFPSNSYICAAGEGRGAILIDVGLDAQPIDLAVATLGLRPTHVFCTHGHFDHLGQAAFFQNKYGTPVHLHHADEKTARGNNFLLMAMKQSARISLPDLTLVDDGFARNLAGRLVSYRHTPGHTPGSCVIAFGNNLFTGDTIYAHGVGLSKLPGERPDQLRESILSVWEDLDGFIVHPGHGPSAPGPLLKRGNTSLLSFLGIVPNQESPFANA